MLLLRPAVVAASRQISGLGIHFIDGENKTLPTYDTKQFTLGIGDVHQAIKGNTGYKKGTVVDVYSDLLVRMEHKSNSKHAYLDVTLDSAFALQFFSSYNVIDSRVVAPFSDRLLVRGVLLEDVKKSDLLEQTNVFSVVVEGV